MKNKLLAALGAMIAVLVTCACATPADTILAPNTQATATSATEEKSTLLQFDFNDDNSGWPEMTGTSPGKAGGVSMRAERGPVGTIDVAGSTEASGGVRMTVSGSNGRAAADRTAFGSSGLLPLRNSETNLAKLTLAFSLSVSTKTPVIVRMESFDAVKKRTGGLETTVYPAAPDFHQRYALDFSTMKGFGGGNFQPTAPFVQLSVGTDGGTSETQLRLDNVHFAKPAFYISPKGNDKNLCNNPFFRLTRIEIHIYMTFRRVSFGRQPLPSGARTGLKGPLLAVTTRYYTGSDGYSMFGIAQRDVAFLRREIEGIQ